MSAKRCAAVVCGATVLCIGDPGAQALTATEIGVLRPFPSAEAVNHLQDYLAKAADPSDPTSVLPDGVTSILPSISYWGYSIEPTDAGKARIYFTQRYDLDAVLDEARGAMKALNHDGCSFVHVGDVTFDIAPKLISFHAPMSGKERTCVNLLLGDLVTDIGDIGGSASGSIGFEVAESSDVDKFHGKINPTNLSLSGSAKAESVFGINTSSVVGQLITTVASIASSPLFKDAVLVEHGVPAWAVMSRVNDVFGRQHGSVVVASQYMLDHGGAVSQKEYSSFLAKVSNLSWSTQPYWVMDADRTVFASHDGHLTLQVTFHADVTDDGSVEMAVESAQEEVDLLKSFSSPGEEYKISKGDNWWRIAESHYRSGYLWPALLAAQADEAKARVLHPGQTISVPPLYTLAHIPGHHVVRPGETLRGLCMNWRPDSITSCVEALAQANPGSKRQLYALQVLQVPTAFVAAR